MILFCDFDGTLFRRDIEGEFERNLEAIQRWRAAGNLFVMTTGRSPSSLGGVLPNYFDYFDYLIGDNGAVCLTKDGVGFEETISEVAQRDITEFVKKLPHGDEFEFVYDRDCHGFSDIQGAATKLRIWTVNPEIMQATIAKLKEVKAAIPATFDEAEENYLAKIDEVGPQIQEVYRSTLNGGFQGMAFFVAVCAAIGLIVLFPYREKKAASAQEAPAA